MKVIFARNRKPFSLLVRFFTWSHWSHCAMIDSSGLNVYEATALKGVTVTPLDEFNRRYNHTEIAEVPSVDNWETLARAEIGKPYDWLAVFAVVLRSRWNGKRNWFCSEYIAHCSGFFRANKISRITPEYLWVVSK